jgi:predicted nucleic acid-binding protein
VCNILIALAMQMKTRLVTEDRKLQAAAWTISLLKKQRSSFK